MQDHPRVCGKDRHISCSVSLCEGSPPRVREGPAVNIYINVVTGITPACAGRTWFELLYFDRWRDHPRVCGKDKYNFKRQTDGLGSPPRVREGLYVVQVQTVVGGITPACAGRTPTHTT